MSVVLPKSFLYQFLFAVCIFVPYIGTYELTFSVWIVTLFTTISNKYSISILQHVFCFVVIFITGFIVMFLYDYKAYYIVRDITYILKPIIGLLLGYQLCKNNYAKAFQTIVYAGVIVACYHFIVLFNAFMVYHARTVAELRYYAGYFSDFEVYVLIILIFHERFNLGFSRKKLFFFTLIIGFSSFLYLARTNFIQFFILIVAMKGFLKINKTSIMVISSLIAFTIVSYSAILYINPKRNGPGLEAFLYKIKVAPIEPFKTKIDRENWKDFNDNYRSYENITTVAQVSRKGTKTLIFGEGIGSKVDLKQKIWLGDMELRYISILHNGFMTVFLKSGLFGVFFLVISIFLLFRNQQSEISIVNNVNLILLGSGFFMIASYWVFMGYYFIADTKSILFGFLLCYREIAIKKQLSVEYND